MEFDFETNAAVPSDDFESKVPEQYRGLYAPGDDGNYTIADNVKSLVEAYVGTTKTLNGVRNDKKKASDESAARRTALKAVEDLATSLGLEAGEDGVTESLKSYVEDLQGKVKGGAQMKIDLDKINAEWAKKVTELENGHQSALQERDAAVSKHLIGNVAQAAIEKHGGSVALLLPHVMSQVKVGREQADDGSVDYAVRVVDSDGSPRSNGQGGWMEIDDLVADMKTKDTYAPAFASKAPGGVGSQPGTSNRPSLRPMPGGQKTELTANQKIAVGLRKKQHNSGLGMGSIVK